MKRLVVISVIAIALSHCTSSTDSPTIQERLESIPELMIVKPEIEKLMDEKKLNGSVLVYDLKNDDYYSNDYAWAKQGQLPASTYKIVNSIIALETGVVEDDSTVFEWNGEKRMRSAWEKDLIFQDAFQLSCVPCYQEIARNIGTERMNTYLKKLDYGEMDVTEENLDMFWLEGNSRIDQFQQIQLLKRLYKGKLPISKRTDSIVKKMMVIDTNSTYNLRGKTGLSITDDIMNGWFVGYVEHADNVYFFATNVTPKSEMKLNSFVNLRKEMTFAMLKELGLSISQ